LTPGRLVHRFLRLRVNNEVERNDKNVVQGMSIVH
jgi:hypothetical protein